MLWSSIPFYFPCKDSTFNRSLPSFNCNVLVATAKSTTLFVILQKCQLHVCNENVQAALPVQQADSEAAHLLLIHSEPPPALLSILVMVSSPSSYPSFQASSMLPNPNKLLLKQHSLPLVSCHFIIHSLILVTLIAFFPSIWTHAAKSLILSFTCSKKFND